MRQHRLEILKHMVTFCIPEKEKFLLNTKRSDENFGSSPVVLLDRDGTMICKFLVSDSNVSRVSQLFLGYPSRQGRNIHVRIISGTRKLGIVDLAEIHNYTIISLVIERANKKVNISIGV